MDNSIIDTWITSTSGSRSEKTLRLKKIFELQEKFLFHQYEPIKSTSELRGTSFFPRLENWLSCFDNDEDRWSIFKSLRYFLFVGLSETEELYRCAVQNHLYPWLADKADLDIFSSDFSIDLDKEIMACWPCPASDSLRINSLLHCTGLTGHPLRPDWYSLRILGSKDKIEKHIDNKKYKYLVLFEDFVGSGTQIRDVLNFALKTFPGDIFFSPLVVCGPGDKMIREIQSENECRLFYSPVVVLDESCLVGPDSKSSEPKTFAGLRVAMENGYLKGKMKLNGGSFGHEGVGCLFASYSNCPNNTPPVFHEFTEDWMSPIFPRKPRVPNV